MTASTLPLSQAVVSTPIVGKSLDLRYTKGHQVRRPNDGEVVVKLAWSGICSSDAIFSTGPLPGYSGENHIAGHEGIGVVVQSHDPSHLNKAVAIRYMGSYCNQCLYCTRDIVESCTQQTNFPKQYSGTFQQYMTVPWQTVNELPAWVLDERCSAHISHYAAALCSGSTALRSVEAASLQPGDLIMVSGIFGAIGHLVGMLAKAVFHAKVIGVDLEWKEASAPVWFDKSKVYDWFVPAQGAGDSSGTIYRDMLRAACKKARPGQFSSGVEMPDAVIIATSSASAYQDLHKCVRDGGSVICVGAPKGPCSITIPAREFMERQLRFQGSMMGGFRDALRMMEYFHGGIILPQVQRVMLADVPHSLRDISDSKCFGKAVVDISGGSTKPDSEEH
ncbi:uncharacterized protein N7459_007424 [Penicillium hispanicum]|uniref:uncharacterized protein n=1 Tax=Penicillium hispanicum TaxID=1080232 RepID=UPI00253FE2D3|nr:uncharacterized protein N7459_007424 [Penicillium hispanicum]KAJ5578460.1 hypothetical protein N7459_007424 [Penicillium hispanicum]